MASNDNAIIDNSGGVSNRNDSVASNGSSSDEKLNAFHFFERLEKQDSSNPSTGDDTPSTAEGTYTIDPAPSTYPKSRVRSSTDVTQGARRPWRRNLIRFGPLSGMLAMGLATLSLVASIGVLVKSDRDSVNDWPTPPSTYLAIFAAIANLSMRYAAIQGIIVAWWVRASRKSSLSKLHHEWRSGTSIRGALTAGRHMGVLGLACICSTIVVIDGPLLQRSSTVVQAQYQNHPDTLEFNIAPELPRGECVFITPCWRQVYNSYGSKPVLHFCNPFTKTASCTYQLMLPGRLHRLLEHFKDNWSVTFNDTVPTPHGTTTNHIIPGEALYLFSSVVNDWHAEGPISGIVSGCPGECSGQLIAPALTPTSCATHILPVNYTTPYRSGEQPQINQGPPLGTQNFILSSILDVSNEQEKLDIVTGFAKSEDCVGTLNYTVCILEAASAEYNITINDNKVTLDNAADPKILSLSDARVNNDTYRPGQHLSTLAGISALLYDTWDSYVITMNIDNALSQWYQGGGEYQLFVDQGDNSACPSFRDPRQAYLASINELMVYLGQAVAQGVGAKFANLAPNERIKTTSIGELKGVHNIYHTDYWFLLGAALVEFICICFVAPTYWGWWKLGRPVSFSPLEIAKAFEAPMLEDADSNSSGRDLARAYRDRDVQYGAAVRYREGDESKLAFIDPDGAMQPEQGCYFDV